MISAPTVIWYFNLKSGGFMYDKKRALAMMEMFPQNPLIPIDVTACPYHAQREAPQAKQWLHDLIKSKGLELNDEQGIREQLGVVG